MKSFQADWMIAIKTSTKENQIRNQNNFYVKYEKQYPTVIFYIQKEFIDQYKEQIVRYQTDRKIHQNIRIISRGETSYEALKRDLNNSSEDIKEVVDKF